MKAKEEHLRVGDIHIFRSFHRKDVSFGFNYHFHKEIEITYIVKGSGTRFIGEHVESYGPGELVVVPAGMPHSWKSNPTTKIHEDWVLQIPVQKNPFWQTEDLQELYTWLISPEAKLSKAYLSKQSRITLEKKFLEIDQSHTELRLVLFLTMLNQIRKLKWNTLGSELFLSSNYNEREIKWMNRIESWLLHYGKESVPNLANSIKTSESTLRRFVKHNTGYTLVELLSQRRIRQARVQLLHNQQTITDIAFDVGYKNLSHFNREFKKLTGSTPRDWQRENID